MVGVAVVVAVAVGVAVGVAVVVAVAVGVAVGVAVAVAVGVAVGVAVAVAVMTTRPTIEHTAQCAHCRGNLVLRQDAECDALTVAKWLPSIVCNPCGKYLESYRRISEAVERVCGQLRLATYAPSTAGQVKAAADDKLTALTQEFDRLLAHRWNTVQAWSHELVEIIMAHPDNGMIALRMAESERKRWRAIADKKKKETDQQLPNL